MRDIIYNILVRYYVRLYGYDTCDYMTEYIADRINTGEFLTRGDIMHYIWMNTSGGGVADASSSEIQAAFPHLILDSDKRSPWKGRVK